MNTGIEDELRTRIHQLEKDNASLMSGIAMLRQVIDNVDAHIYWKDINGAILGANRRNALALAGKKYSLVDVIGKTEMDFAHMRQYAQAIRENDKKVLQKGGLIEFEEECCDLNGNNVVFISRKDCLRADDGKVIGVMGISVDISKRKQYEDHITEKSIELQLKLQQAELTLQQILDSIDANVYWKDLNGNHLGMNKSNLKSLGLNSIDQIIGKSGLEHPFTSDFARLILKNDNQVLLSSGSHVFEEEYPKGDGNIGVYLAKKSCLRNNNGEVVGLVGVSIDITERKEKEKALADKTAEFEAEKIRIQEFIHNFHHDLRTPITGILSNLALLKRNSIKIKDELFHRGLSLVSEGMYAISDMTEQLYLYTKEDKEQEKCFIGIDIEKLVKQELNIAMVSIGERNIILDHCFMPRHIPRFYGDYVKVMQILRNLLSNAVKYTHEGKVEVIVQVIQQHKDDILLRIKVADTGAGIAQQDKERIFEVGYRAEKHRKSGVHGTGFGLAVVKKNLDILKGTFGVTSVLGQGTEIWVDIPFKVRPHK